MRCRNCSNLFLGGGKPKQRYSVFFFLLPLAVAHVKVHSTVESSGPRAYSSANKVELKTRNIQNTWRGEHNSGFGGGETGRHQVLLSKTKSTVTQLGSCKQKYGVTTVTCMSLIYTFCMQAVRTEMGHRKQIELLERGGSYRS